MARARPIELLVRYDDSAVVKGLTRTQAAIVSASQSFSGLNKAMTAAGDTKHLDAVVQAYSRVAVTMQGVGQMQLKEVAALQKVRAANEGLADAQAKSTQKTVQESSKRVSAKAAEARATREIMASQQAAEMEAARGIADRWARARAAEAVSHKFRLQKFAENNAAIEAEQARHAAKMANITAAQSVAQVNKYFQGRTATPASGQATPAVLPAYAMAYSKAAQDVKAGGQKLAEAKENVAKTLTAYDRKLLLEERASGLARAKQETDQFNRDRFRIKAQTEYKLKLFQGDAAMTERILKTHFATLTAISNRESNFSNTPFQKMLTNQSAMLKKFGPLIQQTGYQVGDFAVQVASGQGLIRPLIQQATQLVQFMGPWGAAIGAVGAVAGAFAIYFMKAKDSVEGLTSAIRAADYGLFIQQNERLARSYQFLADSTNGQVKATIPWQKEASNAAALTMLYGSVQNAAAASVKVHTQEVNENRRALTALFGSVEAAAAAYGRLRDQTVAGLKLDVKVAGLELKGDSAKNAKEIQRLQNEAAYQEMLRGFDQQRVAVQGWEQKKAADGKTYLETEKEYKKRQADEIARINEQQAQADELQKQKGTLALQKIDQDYTKKSTEEAKRRSDERLKILQDAIRREQEEARKFYEGQIQSRIDLAERLAVAQGQTEMQRLQAKHLFEKAEHERTKQAWVMTEAEYKRHQENLATLQLVQSQEIINQQNKERDQTAEKIRTNNQKIAQSYMAIGGVIAETFDVGPLQKALMWMQRIQTVLQAIAAIRTATTTLRALSAPVNPLGALFGGFIAEQGGRVPLPRFDIGGRVRGPRHSGGGVPVELEGGEHVWSRRDVMRAGGHRAVEAMKQGGSSSSYSPTFQMAGDTIVIEGSVSTAQARDIGRAIADGKLDRVRNYETTDRVADYFGVSA